MLSYQPIQADSIQTALSREIIEKWPNNRQGRYDWIDHTTTTIIFHKKLTRLYWLIKKRDKGATERVKI